jgi:hypothetical protein
MARVRSAISRRLFDQRAYHPGRPHIIGLGDSHAQAIGRAARRLDWPHSIVSVTGATAQGLHNPNSKTNALVRFDTRCARSKPWQQLVFLLGEVDCGFVIWYRAQKYGVRVEDQLRYSLAAYTDLIARNAASHTEPPIVLSLPPPTIRDGELVSEVAKARREVTASQRERTDLTLEYNERLSAACGRIGARYVDVTTATIDPATRLVRDEFRHPDVGNIHLDPARYAALIAAALADLLR